MTYHITACTRLEDACALLAAEIRGAHYGNPLDGPTVLVQSRAMGRWLGTELARHATHGVMGGLNVQLANTFCRALVATKTSGADPYSEVGLLWRIDALLAEDALLPSELTAMRPLLAPLNRAGRHLLAGELAQIFDKLQICREDWLNAWGAGLAVPEATAIWMGPLWRLLQIEDRSSTDQNITELITQLQTAGVKALPASCPERLYVIAPTTLTPSVVRLLQAVGDYGEVDVHLIHVAPTSLDTFWADLPNEAPDCNYDPERSPLTLDNPVSGEGNRLLANCARQGHDLARLIAQSDESGERTLDLESYLYPATEEPPASLLAAVQAGVRSVSEPNLLNREDDDSLVIHRCHGPRREAEVLRDALAGFLSGSDIRPDEVLVAVPDLPTWGPILEATLGGDGGDGAYLPVHILGRTDADEPLTAAFIEMLSLVDSTANIDAILGIIETPAVLRRFDLSAEDIAILRQRIRRVGISWGVDGDHRRATSGYDRIEGTWRAGIDRLMLGLASGPQEQLLDDCYPWAPTLGGDEQRIGALAAFIDIVGDFIATCYTDGKPALLETIDWRKRLLTLTEDCFLPASGAETAVYTSLRRAIGALPVGAAPCDLETVRLNLERQLSDETTGGGWIRGGITVAPISAMRHIPFKVVAIVGLDGSFPRSAPTSPFDPSAEHRRLGDPSLQLDDRQAFLDLVLSARQHLHLSWSGMVPDDGSEREPSTCMQALIDLLDTKLHTAEGARCDHRAVLVPHPLHATSSAAFDGHPPKGYRPWISHDQDACAAANSRQRRDQQPHAPSVTPFLDGPLASGAAPAELSPDSFAAWLTKPLDQLAGHCLHLRFPQDDPTPDAEPIALNHLGQWRLKQDLLDGSHGDDAEKRWLADGLLPHGHAGYLEAERAREATSELELRIQALLEQQGADPALRARSYQVKAEPIEDGQPLIRGTLNNCDGSHLLILRNGSLRGEDLVRAWVHHLTLHRAGALVTTLVLGKAPQKTSSRGPLAISHTGCCKFAMITDPSIVDDHWQKLISLFNDCWQMPRAHLPELAMLCQDWSKGIQDESKMLKQLSLWQGGEQDSFNNTRNELSQPKPTVRLLLRGIDDPTDEAHGFPAFMDTLWTPLATALEAVPVSIQQETDL